MWEVECVDMESGHIEKKLRDEFDQKHAEYNGAAADQFEAALEAVYNIRQVVDGDDDRYDVCIKGDVAREPNSFHGSYISVRVGSHR